MRDSFMPPGWLGHGYRDCTLTLKYSRGAGLSEKLTDVHLDHLLLSNYLYQQLSCFLGLLDKTALNLYLYTSVCVYTNI